MVVRCERSRADQRQNGSATSGGDVRCSRRLESLETRKGRVKQQALLKDSDLAALEWWDHKHNTPSDFDTATVTATRVCRSDLPRLRQCLSGESLRDDAVG